MSKKMKNIAQSGSTDAERTKFLSEGQVVSKTLTQNQEKGHLLRPAKGEEISTHESGVTPSSPAWMVSENHD